MAIREELLELLRRGRNSRSRRVPIQLHVAEPDAVNETMRASGLGPERMAQLRAIVELQLKHREAQQKALSAKRDNYRRRKTAELELRKQLGLVIFEFPADMMSDEAVDAAIALEQQEAAWKASQPQIGPANPVWDYPAETRRALGYYTQEERELAARMNDMRSNTFLANVMPNFGRQVAYNNPGAEMDAFRGTATYIPNAFMAGASFGLPSATTAAVNGARAGWAAAGNAGQKVWNAATSATKAAAPVVTNPRWATTTAAFTVPAVALASNDGSYAPLIAWGIGLPVGLGLGYKGFKYVLGNRGGATQAALTAERAFSTTYTPDKRFFTWERPGSWVSRLRVKAGDARMSSVIDEWNAATGNPASEKAFIDKYKIRSTDGVPEGTYTTSTVPRTYRETKMETVTEPVMEEVPSSILGLDGRPIMTTRPKLNADGTPITLEVQREVRDIFGLPVTYERPLLDDAGKPVMEERSTWTPKLDDLGLQVYTYPSIEASDVSNYLTGHLIGYSSTIPVSTSGMIFRGPTTSLARWARARNLGRLASWIGLPVGLGYGGYHLFRGGSSSTTTNNPNGDNSTKLVNDSATNTTRPDSVTVQPYIEILPDGRVVTSSSSGVGNDTTVIRKYETPEFMNEE